ncbi:MAG: hypothetical protein JXR69_09165 [Candidatus Delongbacteria bacterium]|nr:hypothetical protein [Candidatus Delongbacteria bacterium]
MIKRLLLLLIFISICNSFGINFYSNPDDFSKYVSTGMYPENKLIKKIPLNTNWQFKLEGLEEWKDIFVPSCYDDYDQDKKIYFRTNFFLGGEKSSDRSYKLVFYGINYSCNIKINDIFVENHSSINSFEVNLNNNQLKFDDTNTLVVELSNKLSQFTIPAEMQVNDWRNYGGIFRDVYLIITSQTSISDANIRYYFENNNTIVNSEVSANIKDNNFIKVNETDSIVYDTKIYSYIEVKRNSDNKTVYKSDDLELVIRRYSDKLIKFNFKLKDPKLWSPNDPNLYRCSVFLGKINAYGKKVDYNRYDFNFGYKDLQIVKNNFVLNGEKFVIQGISRYEDIMRMGNSITYSMMQKEIEKIKNIGSNVLYCNSYPPHPYILDLCDKYGIFVLEDLPINTAPKISLSNKEFIDQAYDILDKLVKRDENHVSLFGVGLGFGYNVFDLQAVDFIKDLADRTKVLNDDLLTFFTSNYTEIDEYYNVTDFNVIDLSKPSNVEYSSTEIKNIAEKAVNKPLIVNNKLIRVYPGNQNGFIDPHSEPAQAKAIIENYRLVIEENNLSGIIIDSFRDHRTDVSLLTNRPDDDLYIVRNGLIDYNGNERISYMIVDALFKGRKPPTLSQGEFKVDEINIYFILGLIFTIVFLYMTKREHYLFVNSVRSLKNPDAFYIDIRDRRVTQILHSVFIGFLSSFSLASILSAVFYSFRQNEKFDYFLTYFIRNDILKKYLTYSSWEPMIFLITVTSIITLLMIVLALCLKIISVFFNLRYSMPIAINMVFWNSIVFLPLLPISAVFLRVFSSFSVKLVTFLFVGMLIWFVVRMFLIMAISFKTSVRNIIWMNLAILISSFLLYIYFFEFNYYKISYFFYLIDKLSI